MTLPSAQPLLLPMLIALSLSGCASREFVQQEVDGVGKRIEELRAMLDRANQRIDTNTRWLVETEDRAVKTEAGQAALNSRLDAMATDLAMTGARAQAVAGDLAATSQRIDANAAAIAGVNQRLDGFDGRLAAVASQAASAQQGVAGTGVRITGLEGEIAAVKAAAPGVAALAPIEPVPVASPPSAPVTTPLPPAPVVLPAAVADNRQAPLAGIAARIDAATRQIDEHTRAILAASERMKAVEAGLVASAQRSAGHDAAIAAAAKRIDNLETTLAVALNKIENADQQLAEQGDRIKTLDGRVGRAEQDIGQASATAREALERAQAAGKLAEGKLIQEIRLSDETAPFGFQSAELTDETKQLLSALANKLKAANEAVYVEIQGHTDDSGPIEANRRLAQARAEAVRDYLHGTGGLPLHRLAVVSYGESRPLADNKTRSGRAQNRRVQLIVLK